MLDLTGILFSSVMILLVTLRAVQMDRAQPWFQRVKRETKPKPAGQRPWQRQS